MIISQVTVTAENTFTDEVKPVDTSKSYEQRGDGFYATVSGTISNGSIATLQFSNDGGTSWIDLQTFEAADRGFISDVEQGDALYRLGVKTDEYGDGDSVICTISR